MQLWAVRPLPPNGAREWQKPTFFSGNSTLSANCLGWRRGCLGEENAWRSRSFGLPPIPRLGGMGEAIEAKDETRIEHGKRDSQILIHVPSVSIRGSSY